MVTGAIYIAQTVRGRQALLFLLGGAAGVILYHAAFGFTSAWRVFFLIDKVQDYARRCSCWPSRRLYLYQPSRQEE